MVVLEREQIRGMVITHDPGSLEANSIALLKSLLTSVEVLSLIN